MNINPCLGFGVLILAGTMALSAPAPAKSALPPNPNKLAPPPGFPLAPEVRTELAKGTQALSQEIEALRAGLKTKPEMLALLPDIEIFRNAVQYALEDDIFYSTNQQAYARVLLQQGAERARQLRAGQAPWNTATGLVVRGYVSRMDGSVQPYGLVVPPEYQPGGPPTRLDFWFHGRGDTLSELAFIEQRQKSFGDFTPANTIVLHPYGRFCNASKFAGEVDAFEALENVQRHYRVDTNRIVVRGFSMGGATAWHIGAHYAGRWAAVNPGAGFVDVVNFQRLANKLDSIPRYEQQLWNFYDPLGCAINLVNTTLVGYSGEDDAQKAAGDLMEQALAREGIKMIHIIGPKTGHRYEPEAKLKVAALVDAAAQGRNALPAHVRLVTYSLKFNQMHWLEIQALERHWEKAGVDAEIEAGNRLVITTRNVAILKVALNGLQYAVTIDGQTPAKPRVRMEIKDAIIWLRKTGGQWQLHYTEQTASGLAKCHNLQGPIDDAFMDSFIMVRPTGKFMNDALEKWTAQEMAAALFQWRRQFRGAARVKNDRDITPADIQSSNLVLWGDPASNHLLARIADKLPIHWTKQGIVVRGKTYAAEQHALVLIYPNPLNPKRYVVLNSGFTFPQYGTGSNALQTPKLPDWAILDLGTPWAERISGKGVVAADFFGERWELPNPQQVEK